jgi:hypothetical protein
MTLILGLINRAHTVLVSDRRLTCDGVLVEEESNKAATLVCRDARVAFAFTGLARQGGFRTDRWLLEALSSSASPDFLMEPIIARFCERATRDLASVTVRNPADKRLSIAMAGYVYDQAVPRCYYWLISNFEKLGSPPQREPGNSFEVSSYCEPRSGDQDCYTLFIAGTDVVSDDAVASMWMLLKEERPASALVGKAIEVLRATADSPKSRDRIGKQCTSIVLPSDPSKAAEVEYHTATATHTVHGVSHIEARGGEFGVYVIADPEIESRNASGAPGLLAIPKVGRNQPCPCGSGKKYKRCHGRGAR